MSAMAIGWIVFAIVFGGALLGMFVRALLPDHHLSTDSKDTVKLGMGLIGTMAALVLGLLVASAKSSYDTRTSEITQMSTNVILLDRIMAHYGSETKEARELLRQSVVQFIDQIWSGARSRPTQSAQPGRAEGLYERIQALSPQNESQRWIQAQALTIAISLGQTRWLLVGQSGSSIPVPFLVVLVFWLAVIFVSWGLFAPRNATVIATLFVCALSFSCAVFLILELDRPFEGLIQISSAPMRDALAVLGR
jgi:hypothetical protein